MPASPSGPPRERLHWWRATSLQTRLVLGVLVLAAVGLAVADVVGLRALHHAQITRIDQELRALGVSDGAARPGAAGPLLETLCQGRPPPARPGPNTFFQACLSPSGAVVTNGSMDSTLGPARVPTLTIARAAALSGRAMTVGSTSGDGQWRVVATPLADGSGTVVVGQSLHELAATSNELLLIDVAVSAAVLLALIVFAYAVVRVGLRPLSVMTRTADGIAAGDLSLRAPAGDRRTEVGRLGLAFNHMLAEIQRALRDRERSSTRLREFAADASHELRTPLTSIRGFAELYRQGAVRPGPDLDRMMGRIEAEAIRMGSLVEDLLQLARLDEGPAPDVADVDLERVADDTVHDARAIEPGRPVELEPGGPLLVRGNDGQLRQVATNLLANACQHTPPGTPVHVRTYLDGAQAVLEVADEGPGLTAADTARAFDRFWRADPSRARPGGGSGLGLAIVAAVAVAHGGTVEVDSEPGCGATFRVRLPRAGPA